MKKAFVLSVLLASSLFGFSQDIIYLINGTSIEAANVKIESKKIEYQKYSNSTGPFYQLTTNQVASIVFQNGDRKDYNAIIETKPGTDNSTSGNSLLNNPNGMLNSPYYNSIGFNFGMILARQIEFDYEHRFSNSIIGLSVPVVFSFDPGFLVSLNDVALLYSGGIDMNLYVIEESVGKTSYEGFLGLGLDIGGAQEEYTNAAGVISNHDLNFFTAYGILGGRLYASERISVEGSVRVGGRNYLNSKNFDIEPIARPHVRVRYHF